MRRRGSARHPRSRSEFCRAGPASPASPSPADGTAMPSAPAPERRDLGDDGTSAGGDRAPVEAVGGHGEDIALLIAGYEKKKRLIRREQLLDLFDLQRPW